VLLESEFESNRHIADVLTELGHPTSIEEALRHYTGLSGRQFTGAVEKRIGTTLPDEFHRRLRVAGGRALEEGLAAVAGAIDFVRALPADLPRAVASSSTVQWIRTHLRHLDLEDAFGEHVYSGAEHVEHGKPSPDIYLFAAERIGAAIEECAIIEDSEIGATGALASGARVIGLAAGLHCLDGHDDRLRSLGVHEIAHSFDDVRALLDLG
jgi:HAD superfamily hydrolase (TIGR01509 family)